MKTNKVFIFLCFEILLFDSTVFAQTITNKPIFEANSIKVIANSKFPQDLESEIFVGPKECPYFRVEGTQDKLKSAEIVLDGNCPTVSVLPKEGGTNSYVLYLFTKDADGKILALFDLNFDGVWDVKGTPTREQKHFILFENHWVAVAKIDGLKSLNPKAEAQGIHYEYQNGWKMIK